jgi:hypothetical protein
MNAFTALLVLVFCVFAALCLKTIIAVARRGPGKLMLAVARCGGNKLAITIAHFIGVSLSLGLVALVPLFVWLPTGQPDVGTDWVLLVGTVTGAMAVADVTAYVIELKLSPSGWARLLFLIVFAFTTLGLFVVAGYAYIKAVGYAVNTAAFYGFMVWVIGYASVLLFHFWAPDALAYNHPRPTVTVLPLSNLAEPLLGDTDCKSVSSNAVDAV